MRVAGDEVVIVARTEAGLAEIARHPRSTPGRPRLDDAHYPDHPDGRGTRGARPRPVESDGAGLPADRPGRRGNLARRGGRVGHGPGAGQDGPGARARGAPGPGAGRDGPRARGRGRTLRRGRSRVDPRPSRRSRARRSADHARRGVLRPAGHGRLDGLRPMNPPAPPALPPELTAVLQRLRLPYIRRTAPEVLAVARAQRCRSRRGAAGPARRRGRRAGRGDDGDAAAGGRVPVGQDPCQLA